MIPIDTLLLFIDTTLVVVISPSPAAIAVTAEDASCRLKRSILQRKDKDKVQKFFIKNFILKY